MFVRRGLVNLGCPALLLLDIVTLLRFFSQALPPDMRIVVSQYFNGGFNYGGSNASDVVCLSFAARYIPEHLIVILGP